MRKIFLFFSVALFFLSSLAYADEVQYFQNLRDYWANKGLTFDFSSINDFISVYKGGLRDKNTWLGEFDMISELDLEKSGLLKGGLIHLDLLDIDGGLKPTADHLVGDLQGVDGIEAPRSNRIYEGWYQQSLWDKRLSVKLGIIDLNSEFMYSDSGNLYINGAFDPMTSYAISNNNDAVYPEPVPAVRLKYSPNDHWDFLVGFFQGDPLSPDVNPHSTHFGTNEGLLSIEEGQYHYQIPFEDGLSGTFKAGFWYNSRDEMGYQEDYGAYALLDQAIFKMNDNRGLNIFVEGGEDPQDRNLVKYSLAGGFNYTGLIPYRPKDIMGLALTQAVMSDDERTALQGNNETTYEWTYQINILNNFQLQPDIQYVEHPDAQSDIKNATVFILRTIIHF